MFGEKIPKVRGLVVTTLLNVKIGKVENKTPGICGLVTTAVNRT